MLFLFYSCCFHGHDCHLTHGKTHHPYNENKTLKECRDDTERIRKEIEKFAPVIEMWECDWLSQKANNQKIKQFLSDKNISFKSALQGKVTQASILEKVKSGELFGLVQCDIHVPDNLKPYFEDLPPLFKNTNVSREDIGEHMETYCINNKLMRQPRRTLISSFFGENVLLTTPLLKWYLQQGLVVTDIQQIVEYKPNACFKRFGENVTFARREGDKNTDSSILADTWKLLGNSGKIHVMSNNFLVLKKSVSDANDIFCINIYTFIMKLSMFKYKDHRKKLFNLFK